MDNKIITAIYRDRNAYDVIKELVTDPNDLFSNLNGILYEKASEYYENDSEAQSVDSEIVRSGIEREYPRHYETINMALQNIAERDISVINVLKEYVRARKYVVGQELATMLLNGGNEDVDALMEEYRRLENNEVGTEGGDTSDVEVLHGLSGSVVKEARLPENIIPLFPSMLNEQIDGGCSRGHHVLVFARPETGKSLMVLNFTRQFLEDGRRVLYIGNEDPASSLRTRLISSILQVPTAEVRELDEETIDTKLANSGAVTDNLYFVSLSPGTFPQIRSLCKRYNPDVLIVDQIRNLNTNADGLVHGQERAGIEMRNIAGEFNLLSISVAQAGESASGKLVLGLSDIDNSKTGLPASVDLMVGIGVSDEYEQRGKRMVSLPKNKLGSGHPFFSIDVDENTSRIS